MGAKAEGEKYKCKKQSTRPKPMVNVPAVLLFLPVARERSRCPPANAIIDRHRSNERKQYGKDLKGKSRRIQTPCRIVEMLKGQSIED